MSCSKIFHLLLTLALCSLLCACPKTDSQNGTAALIPQALSDGVDRGDLNLPSTVISEDNNCFKAKVIYPFTGRPKVDMDIHKYVDDIYAGPVRDFAEYCAKKDPKQPQYEINMDYESYAPSANVISILFKPWMYTGGAHGLGQVRSANYDIKNGRVLQLENIFAKPAGLLEFFSDYSRKTLRPKLGKIWQENEMFAKGLDPEEENFSVFVLKKDGIVLYFPVYQVAPYASGVQQCFIPREELTGFMPKPGIWE